MAFSIQTNVNALVAQENLRVNGDFQSRTIQRLTSGYRINSSGDDAAGLSVANKFRSDTAELSQGVRNANDGISQMQIIDGGLNNISKMLDRLKTLATQSASTTFTGDRTVLNKEFKDLLTEIDRQADNIGLGANNAANSKVARVYIGGGQDANTNAAVNIDLSGVAVGQVGLGLANASVLTTGAVVLGTAAAATIAAGKQDVFTVATATGEHVITVLGHTGDTLASQLQDLNAQLQPYNITASLDSSGKLQLQSSSAFSVKTSTTDAVNNSLINKAGTDKTVNLGLNNIGYTPAAGAENLKVTVGGSTTTIAIDGTATMDTTAKHINATLSSQGVTSVTAVIDETTGKISLQSSTTFSASSDGDGTGATYTSLGAVTPGAGAGDPNAAINAVSAAVKALGLVAGKVGAGQNSLNYAINLAQSQISNFSAAESRIRDADVASEAANLTKAQVLQQASIAAMAQANAAPQAVLALLRG